jgi:hypothetical protein
MDNVKGGKRRNLSIGLFVATSFLIAIETIFFIPAISSVGLAFQDPSQSKLLLPQDLGSLALWMIIPIIYCSIVSIMLRPKRLVNPVHVQVMVISIAILMVIHNLAMTNGLLPQTTQSLGLLFLVVAFSSLFVCIIGVLQWQVVGWVIRVNYEDSDRVSFVVNMQTKEILHKLGSSFIDTWDFSRHCDIGEIWRLDRNDGNDRCLVLEIGSHPKDDKKSILATVAYELQHNWIVKSDVASTIREIIIQDIEKRLNVQFSNNHTDLDDSVSRLANSNVKDLARSRIEVTWGFLHNISRFYQAMMALTVILLIGLSITYFYFGKYVTISSDTYIGVTIALIISLFIEIGFPLREELSKKKRDELEF